MSWRPARLSGILPKHLTFYTLKVGKHPSSYSNKVQYFVVVTTCFSAGIAHRDLKLENILCEYTDKVSGY